MHFVGKAGVYAEGNDSTEKLISLASQKGVKVHKLTTSPRMKVEDLFSEVRMIEGSMRVEASPFVTAFTEGGMLLIDENNVKTSADVIWYLRGLIENPKYLFVPGEERMMKGHPDFFVAVSYNSVSHSIPGMFQGMLRAAA